MGLSSLTQILIATCAFSSGEEKLQTCPSGAVSHCLGKVWLQVLRSWALSPSPRANCGTASMDSTHSSTISSCMKLMWMLKAG